MAQGSGPIRDTAVYNYTGDRKPGDTIGQDTYNLAVNDGPDKGRRRAAWYGALLADNVPITFSASISRNKSRDDENRDTPLIQ